MSNEMTMARSRPGEATVARLLALADVQLDGPRPWDLQVRDPAMFTRVLAQGSLGFGEAYIDGDWVAADLDDRDWNTSATLRLRPHQALTAAQSQMIRLEYFEGTVGLALTRRAPLVPYLIQAYRAALVPDRELPPAFLLQVHEPEQLPPCACWSETPEDGMGRV
ncbi:hypothetical protein [Arenimonas sp.]|uniref:hypothetical protein n=2 Tax=Arenimonas sp. TaxID=1872635 RepID=UPI0025B7E3A7|nr:hypothetical protein [Arenimonas sp.]